ncbi:MAG: helix-turn-helix transcriptional regulator, partial [Rudaea sp.]
VRGAAASRDAQLGWRGRVRRALVNAHSREPLVRRAMREQDTDPGMATVALVRDAGEFRVRSLRDGFIDFPAFRKTGHYRNYYVEAGVVDRLWVLFPLNRDAESCLFFDLQQPRRRFSRNDAALAGEALRGIKWFHRNLMLSHGLLVADSPLTPTQHRLVRLLLTGRSEAQIAAALGLTVATVHTYVTTLYRRLGVNSRAALMALWLGV